MNPARFGGFFICPLFLIVGRDDDDDAARVPRVPACSAGLEHG